MPPPPQTKPQSTDAANAAAPVASAASTESTDGDQIPAGGPISNTYVTQERLDAWNTGGRDAVVESAAQAQAEGDLLTISLLFEEIVQATMDKSLDAVEIGSTVQKILAAPSSDVLDPVSLFIDTVSTLTETGTVPDEIKNMLQAAAIDAFRMRSDFENNVLSSLDLVRQTFARVAIRKATHALYRQSNYNLLREESEGYSKLITEYFTTVQNQPPNEEVISDTFQRVKALIGAFDLDVGRVLDVTLDVFANLLVKHTRFFVKLLRASSWWPEMNLPHGIEWEEPLVSALPRWAFPGFALWYYSDEEKDAQLSLRRERDRKFWQRVDEVGFKAFFELGARRITNGLPSLPLAESTSETETETEKKPTEASDFEKIRKWNQEWMAETQTLPPSGNRIAAQLLGFKLRFYASDARDSHDTLPDNLIHLAALLIKIGFISLADLYPHLYPLDEDMAAHREQLMKAKMEKDANATGVPLNALAMAGALPDDTLPTPASVTRLRESESKAPSKSVSERGTPSGAEEETKNRLPEPVDQKVALLRSLLCIGAIPEALFILGRFPWLLDVYPDLHRYLFRLAHYSLSKVTQEASPSETDIPVKQGPLQGSPRATDYVHRRTLRWAKPEEKDAGDGGIDYRFYWDDWADNTPVCQNVDDVFKLCSTFLRFIGLRCGEDPLLLTNLARIGKKNLIDDPSPTNMRRWTNLSTTFLGPALTFSGQNPAVVNETWDLFKSLDTVTRYAIYDNWFAKSASRQPAVKAKFAEVQIETKRIFNKISKDNVREMGRNLAKPACPCPGYVFGKALERAEKYSNMTEPLVECCRYLTYLGYDCLNWAFINSLCKQRPTLQGDGMLAESWLKNTAFFIGKAYRRYSLMDPTPIMQFVADRLLKGKLFVMEILEQMITSMVGIGPVLSLTESQVYGLSAGPRLRAFTLEHYLGDTRHACSHSSQRLLNCLKESGLAPQILVALAVELENYVFREEFEEANTPLKVIGNNLDRLHSNFNQYLDFLRSSLSTEDFDALIPGVVELISEFGVSPSIAFSIARTSLSVRFNAARTECKQSPPTEEPAAENQTNGDIVMGDAEEVKPSPDAHIKDVDVEMKDSSDDSTPATSSNTNNPSISRHRTNREVEKLADSLRAAVPDVYKDHICLNFYLTFWQLSLVDVFTVTPMKEMKEYTASWKHYAEKASRVPVDRRDVSRAAAERKNAEVQRLHDLSAALRVEVRETLNAALKMREYLQSEMHQWFEGIPMVGAKSEDLHDTLLQDCFLPRITLSPQDAQFSAAMLKFMHEVGVPGFRTMKFLDLLFRQKLLTNIFFMCTEREASNLGRFLNDTLKELNVWHSSQTNYVKYAQGSKKNLPGFGRTFNVDRTPATFLDYEDFRRLLFKWHTQLFKAFEGCFKSEEYMHIRNAINIMKAIAPSYPKIDTMGKSLYQLVEDLSSNKTDSRDDLKLAALSLLGDIKKGERRRMTQQAFYYNPKAPAAAVTPVSTGQAGSEQAKPSQSQEPPGKKLNAAAKPFAPGTSTNNASETPSTKEDGELKDERRQAGTATADPRGKDKETTKPASADSRPPGPTQRADRNANTAGLRRESQSTTSSLPAPPTTRADSRNIPSSRVPHHLPPRPDPQPPRPPRMPERNNDRQAEYPTTHRIDSRPNAAPEFGRPDRPSAPHRESFGERREMSPGRRRGRTPEGRDPGWAGRDARDPRDYHDERSMRPPPRDMRPVPPPYHSRDTRDLRDGRDRDPRGPPPGPPDTRGRLHAHSLATVEDSGPYRRDYPPPSQQGTDRGPGVPPRQGYERPPNVSSVAAMRGGVPQERSLINPERAALIDDDRPRSDASRPEREHRHDRGSRPQSPRRAHERAPPYHGRSDTVRDPRDDRPSERPLHDQAPPQHFGSSHDWRDESGGTAPTGPRGGRNDSSSSSSRVSREMFMPAGGHSRPPPHQSQDPNYGRLNPPSDSIPSGPRSKTASARTSETTVDKQPDPTSDRRDAGRRELEQQSHAPNTSAPPPAHSGPQAAGVGIHPSRLANINAPPLRTDMANPPSGPRGSGRTPTGPAASSPSTSRGPPTGPASTERNPRNQGGHTLRTINNVLGQTQNNGNYADSSPQAPLPQVRGRGAARASGHMDTSNIPSPAASSSHPSTPNAPRPDMPPSRPDREGRLVDDNRHESRGHRDSRRGDRSGRQRSRSADRGEKRGEDRSSRNGPGDRGPRHDEIDKNSDRDRGGGREKRSGDREARRERDREEHSMREPRERRERNGRDDGRGPSRGEDMGSRRGPHAVGGEQAPWPAEGRDYRGGGGEMRFRGEGNKRRDEARDGRGDARKRGPGEEPPAHRDPKRSRRSNV